MDKKQTFLNEVTGQIRSKEAKKFISKELDHHITYAKHDLVQKGLNEETAEIKAIEQMGNPLKLGMQLNKIHRPKIDWVMTILFVIMLAAGFLPLFTLGYLDEVNFTSTKIKYTFLGVFSALAIMVVHYRKLMKLGIPLYIIGVIILLCINLFPTNTIHGIPTIRIVPLPAIESMITIPFFFLAWASLFSSNNLKVWQFSCLFLIPFSLFILAGNKGACMIYIMMVFVMLWWSSFTRRAVFTIYTATLSTILLSSVILWPLIGEYYKERIAAYLIPNADTAEYITITVQELLSTAGLFGHSSTTEFIPKAHTDLAFVSTTHHYGWIVGIALLAILSFILIRMLQMIGKITDPFGRLLLIGATTIYCVQFLYNIGMAFGLVPMTMISLPFISFGFIPTFLNSCLIGIVLSVYRRKNLTPSF